MRRSLELGDSIKSLEATGTRQVKLIKTVLIDGRGVMNACEARRAEASPDGARRKRNVRIIHLFFLVPQALRERICSLRPIRYGRLTRQIFDYGMNNGLPICICIRFSNSEDRHTYIRWHSSKSVWSSRPIPSTIGSQESGPGRVNNIYRLVRVH